MMEADKKTEICVIMRKYNKKWDEFLKSFFHYKTRMCIDDLGDDSIENRDDIIHMDTEECARKGFKKSSSCANFPDVIAWDKAICHYITNSDADYIWFIEDDVFFMNEDVLLNIDGKYENEDLLTVFHDVNESGELYSWNHWINVVGKIDVPWCHSMVCACRVSRRLLMEVGEYVKQRGELFFVEVIFNTIAHQKGMRIANPVEMSNVCWDVVWNRDDIDPTKLYHPFKKIEDHLYMRTGK